MNLNITNLRLMMIRKAKQSRLNKITKDYKNTIKELKAKIKDLEDILYAK